MRYIIEPGLGVGPVRLGMTPDEVLGAMDQKPDSFSKSDDSRHETDAFHQSCFQVFYDGDVPEVVYIELSSGVDFDAFYAGTDVFKTPANDLVSLISQTTPLDENDPELGYSFTFPNLELSLWRPVMPDSEDDPEGRFFSTVGIGITGYFSRS